MNPCVYLRRMGRARRGNEAWRERIADAVSTHGRLKAVADAVKMTSPQLQKIANGVTVNPGIATLARIAPVIGLTLDQLFAEDHGKEAFKSAHDELLGPKRHLKGMETQARDVPSSTGENGQRGALPAELEEALRLLQDATAELRDAAAVYRAFVAAQAVDVGQEAPAPRVARTGNSKGARKNR